MKTAIAVPDVVFQRVERRVKTLGVSRSEFFARAAERYLDELERADLTARIDAAIEASDATAAAEQSDWAKHARARLGRITADDEW